MKSMRLVSKIERCTWLWLVLAVLPAGSGTAGAQERPVYLDDSKPIEARVDDLLSRLTLEEKVSLVHANSTFSVAGVPRLGIPELWMDDGPLGVREEVGVGFRNMNRTDDFATAMPATLGLAATFNTNLANAYGAVIGQEAKQRGKNIMLGPSLNIQRTPLCGRNFEYMGEDPYPHVAHGGGLHRGRTGPGRRLLRKALRRRTTRNISAAPSTWRRTSGRCGRFTCRHSARRCRKRAC